MIWNKMLVHLLVIPKKKETPTFRKCLFIIVGVDGFEPPTLCL